MKRNNFYLNVNLNLWSECKKFATFWFQGNEIFRVKSNVNRQRNHKRFVSQVPYSPSPGAQFYHSLPPRPPHPPPKRPPRLVPRPPHPPPPRVKYPYQPPPHPQRAPFNAKLKPFVHHASHPVKHYSKVSFSWKKIDNSFNWEIVLFWSTIDSTHSRHKPSPRFTLFPN